MEERLRKSLMERPYGKGLLGLLSAGTLLAAAAGLHDMQTAQGVGLYLSLLAGGTERKWFDLGVDLLGMGALLLLLVIPCLLLHKRSLLSFWRLLAGYLALLPGVSLAALVHLLDPPGVLALRGDFLEGRILPGLLAGIGEWESVLQIWLPFFCLLLFGSGKKELKKWQKTLIFICAFLLLCGILFPAPAPFCSFGAQYLLLLLCFDLWEDLMEQVPRLNLWGMILFAGFWLRGIWMILEVMSIY